MSRIESSNIVIEYPDNKDIPFTTMTIRNHWNRKEMVCIQIGNGEHHTFVAEDIIKAIKNAQNCHEF